MCGKIVMKLRVKRCVNALLVLVVIVTFIARANAC